jgi:hypothetical protein
MDSEFKALTTTTRATTASKKSKTLTGFHIQMPILKFFFKSVRTVLIDFFIY